LHLCSRLGCCTSDSMFPGYFGSSWHWRPHPHACFPTFLRLARNRCSDKVWLHGVCCSNR
jgi:hypothetical protein